LTNCNNHDIIITVKIYNVIGGWMKELISSYDKTAFELLGWGRVERLVCDLLQNGKTISDDVKTRFLALLRSRKAYFIRTVSAISKVCKTGNFDEAAFSWLLRDAIDNCGILGHFMVELLLPANTRIREDLVQIALRGKDPAERQNFISKFYSACSAQIHAAKDHATKEANIRKIFQYIRTLCSDEVGGQSLGMIVSVLKGHVPLKEILLFIEEQNMRLDSPEVGKVIESCFESPTMTVEITSYNWVTFEDFAFLPPAVNSKSLRHKNNPNGEVGAAEAGVEFLERHISAFSKEFIESLILKCERHEVHREGQYPIVPLKIYYNDALIFAREKLKQLLEVKKNTVLGYNPL
jgi:hypothetical protein